MYILRSNYGNNALALIQWAREQQLENVTVVYVDTGWSAAGWLEHAARQEAWVNSLGFGVVHLKPFTPFDEVMEMKGGFPSRQHQWCALHLKGIPFLKWIEETDPQTTATVLLPKS
jgi:3'-phosphoadenosine 5'-phosphosulfate sulfotransferase (PAPS reductase)/FAD synthetase